ncbi:hypothetical protein JQS43_16620 [Natronosporangium hydrolyticum]|uniref:Uncharacterized protein n=1 Tax=Natronosporangium hydrolyticum TaxID=2811111 RepID=A0A895YFD3_9ACTN|nr:hypothetical protein [Natronosporangium hydrolyticum]QSB13246.1 hypothetical protein JQS43_16620 [Natronosporangium hydrolyticum]
MTERETAQAWAKVRSGGPQRVPPGGQTPLGVRRLVTEDAQAAWLLPELPESAGPAVLAEYGLPGNALTDPRGSLRALAACLRCCWVDPGDEIWPGVPAPLPEVAAVFAQLTPGRDQPTRHRTLLGGIRRLAAAGWLRFDERTRTVRLGPRVAAWSPLELSTLRELWRMIPAATGQQPSAGAAR